LLKQLCSCLDKLQQQRSDAHTSTLEQKGLFKDRELTIYGIQGLIGEIVRLLDQLYEIYKAKLIKYPEDFAEAELTEAQYRRMFMDTMDEFFLGHKKYKQTLLAILVARKETFLVSILVNKFNADIYQKATPQQNPIFTVIAASQNTEDSIFAVKTLFIALMGENKERLVKFATTLATPVNQQDTALQIVIKKGYWQTAQEIIARGNPEFSEGELAQELASYQSNISLAQFSVFIQEFNSKQKSQVAKIPVTLADFTVGHLKQLMLSEVRVAKIVFSDYAFWRKNYFRFVDFKDVLDVLLKQQNPETDSALQVFLQAVSKFSYRELFQYGFFSKKASQHPNIQYYIALALERVKKRLF